VGYADFPGFKIEADEAGGGRSELEFVVEPPVPETAGGRQQLDAAMAAVEGFGRSLLTEGAAGPFPLGYATDRMGDNSFRVTPRDTELEAGPQVTSGIDLAKLPEIDRLWRRRAGRRPPTELEQMVAQVGAGANDVRTAVGVAASPELVGLLALIRSYLRTGKGQRLPADAPQEAVWLTALPYPKMVAEPLLARTRFSQLFALLPRREQRFYAERPADWLDLTLRAAGGRDEFDPLGPVIERGVQEDESGATLAVTEVPLRRVEWLLGIPAGRDLLSEIEDAESLGEWGTRTEHVGSELFGAEAGIFELRGAQSRKIPLPRWTPFAQETFEFLRDLND
jgi:hypothetical protein